MQSRQDVKTDLSSRQVRGHTQMLVYGDSELVKTTAAHAEANYLGIDSSFH